MSRSDPVKMQPEILRPSICRGNSSNRLEPLQLLSAELLNMQFILTFLLSTISTQAYAYVGPGMGAGAVAVVLGIAGGILMLLVGVIYYPLKKLIKKLRKSK